MIWNRERPSRGDHGGSQQAGSHRLGRSIQRTGLPPTPQRVANLRRRKRRLRLGSATSRSHFTAPRRRRFRVPTKVCTGQLRRTNSSQRRARNLLPKMVIHDRPVYQEEHAAQLIMARRLHPPLKGRIHLRRPVTRSSLFPCSRAADHTFPGTRILEELSRVAKFAIRGRSIFTGFGTCGAGVGATYRGLWNLSFICHTLVKSRQNPLCVADKR